MPSLSGIARDERTARMVLSMLVEPDDAVTGRLLAAVGGVETLRLAVSEGPVPGVGDIDAQVWRSHFATSGIDSLDGRLLQARRSGFGVLIAGDDHVEVETTWGIYQQMIAAYREPDKAKGKTLMQAVIDAIGSGVPGALTEIITLGRTLRKRAADILAYFDRPGTSNGPTEALNGRLEHLRGSALGFRNLTHYIARSLLETGGFRPRLHRGL